MDAGASLHARIRESVFIALPVFFLTVVLKRSLLLQEAYLGAMRARNGPGPLRPWWLAEYCASDALLVLLAVPLALALAFRTMSSLRHRLASFLVLELLLVVCVIDRVVQQVIGRLPTLPLARDFLEAYWNDAGLVAPTSTMPPAVWVQAVLLVLAGAIPLLVLMTKPGRRLWEAGLGGVSVTLACATVAIATVSTIRNGWPTVLHRPLLAQMGTTLLSGEEPLPPARADLSAAALLSAYRGIAWGSAPPERPVPQTPPTSPLERRNVLVVILETHPAADYDLTDQQLWPSLAKLLPHAIVGRRHYTSNAMSARADFSLLTSVYDLPGRASLGGALEHSDPTQLDALPRLLHQAGYDTRYYYPTRVLFREEESVLPHLGFSRISLGGGMARGSWSSPSERLGAERMMFDTVAAYLRARRSGASPFLVVVRSLIGHDPLIDPAEPDSTARSSPARQEARRFIALTESGLIGGLVDELIRIGELERTVIVIVGDHGIRLRSDPRFRPGLLTDAVIRVPLLVYAGGGFHGPVEVTSPTSHVDISPTILTLLGRPTSGLFHQGSYILDPALPSRATFCLAEGYFGADAVIESDHAYMRSYLSGAAFFRNDLDFQAADALPIPGPDDPPLARELDLRLSRLRQLVEWTRLSLQAGALR